MALEIRVLSPEWTQPLQTFFALIDKTGELHFHPHPFTDASAKMLTEYSGSDLYYLLVDGKEVLAYGLLRGWDQGYDIPSLGIAVHPETRGRKLGELMMHFLHSAARRKGARQVRLKVYRENASALSLYLKLGYRFAAEEEERQLIGRLDL